MSIQNARSNTSGNAPSSLQDGQIAINQADGVLYSRNVDGSIRRFLLPKRRGMADAAFTVLASDTYIGIASLTASRTITLPAASSYPAGHVLTIADESGSPTASVVVTIAAAGSDTINGASNVAFVTPYFGALFVSNGTNKWTELVTAASGTSAALLYTPQTLTAAQQRQTLANLALSAANIRMTEIQAAASKGSYFGLVDGLADGFADNSGIDTANAVNVNVQNGAVLNQALDPSTTFLAHFDGTNGATTTTDDKGHTINMGSNALSTAQAKFGASSVLLAGVGTAGLNSPASSDFAIGSADFTVEGWFYPTSINTGINERFLSIGAGTGDYIQVQLVGSTLTANFNGTTLITGAVVTTGGWVHVALSRSSGNLRLFQNGTQTGSTYTTAFTVASGTPVFAIGDNIPANGTGGAFIGYIDEVRFSKGLGRYNASFTPQTSAFAIGSSGVLTLPSVNYSLSGGVPTKGSIFIRARATADAISPNTNFIASLSRNGTLGGSNSLDVTLAATAVLPDGYTHYEANEVDLTGLTSGSVLKGSLRTVGTSLGVAIDGWRIRAA